MQKTNIKQTIERLIVLLFVITVSFVVYQKVIAASTQCGLGNPPKCFEYGDDEDESITWNITDPGYDVTGGSDRVYVEHTSPKYTINFENGGEEADASMYPFFVVYESSDGYNWHKFQSNNVGSDAKPFGDPFTNVLLDCYNDGEEFDDSILPWWVAQYMGSFYTQSDTLLDGYQESNKSWVHDSYWGLLDGTSIAFNNSFQSGNYYTFKFGFVTRDNIDSGNSHTDFSCPRINNSTILESCWSSPYQITDQYSGNSIDPSTFGASAPVSGKWCTQPTNTNPIGATYKLDVVAVDKDTANSIDLTNGINLSEGFSGQKINILKNQSNFTNSVFGTSPTSNYARTIFGYDTTSPFNVKFQSKTLRGDP